MKKKLGIWAGALLAGAAVIEPLARLNVRSEQTARRHLDGFLYTEERGRGEPIVFLAGFQASTRYSGDAFNPLARDHRLIFVDALGFGRSPWPEVAYTLEDHLSALRRTLLREGVTKDVTLVGHSFGAILAAYYAQRYPDEVHRLLLFGTPVFDNEADARGLIRNMSWLTALFALNRVFARASCDVLCAFRPLAKRVMVALRPDLPQEVAEDAVLHYWTSIDGTLRNVVLTKPVAAALSHVGSKTVLVHGCKDRITSMDRMRRLAADTAARLIETASGHNGYFVDKSDLVTELIQR